MASGATRDTERRPATAVRPELELVRSSRRRRSATAFARDGRIVVQLPAGMAAAEEERLIARLVDKVTGRARARAVGDGDRLAARAARLADAYVDGVRPTSVRWSSRMARRWGSCTPEDGSIRLSDRLAGFPGYVLDYVIVHELAHLVEPGHGRAFHAIVDRYPDAQRARGFLDGIQHAAGTVPSAEPDAFVDGGADGSPDEG
jgi:hypothetical protein